MFEAFNNKYVLDIEKKTIKKKNGRTITRITIKNKTPDLKIKMALIFSLFFAKYWAEYAIIAMKYFYYGVRDFTHFINSF